MRFFSGLQVLPSCARALCRSSPRPAFLAPPCFPPRGFCGRRRQAASFRCLTSGAPFLSLRIACAFLPPDSARQRPRKRMRPSPRRPDFHYLRVHISPFLLIVVGGRRRGAPVFIRLNGEARKRFHFAVFPSRRIFLRRTRNKGRGFAHGAQADFFSARTWNCCLQQIEARGAEAPRARFLLRC